MIILVVGGGGGTRVYAKHRYHKTILIITCPFVNTYQVSTKLDTKLF